jgi:hypothetical protein
MFTLHNPPAPSPALVRLLREGIDLQIVRFRLPHRLHLIRPE